MSYEYVLLVLQNVTESGSAKLIGQKYMNTNNLC